MWEESNGQARRGAARVTMPPSGPWPPSPPGPGQQPSSWGPQPPWGPPKQGGNRGKWVLGGIALVVVIGLTVVATLLVTRDGSGSGEPTASVPPSTSAHTSDIASADDRGPVGIITEDPTCAAWGPINDTLSLIQREGWDARDPSLPRAAWTDQQRNQHHAVAAAMLSAADQTVQLAKRTPHRVMRELYAQSIAYWRAYAKSVDTYEPSDNHLALTANSVSASLVWICSAIDYGAAAARSPLVVPSAPPNRVAAVDNITAPNRAITAPAPSPFCSDWNGMVVDFSEQIKDWNDGTDPNLASIDWPAEQRALFLEVVPLFQKNAEETQQLGLQSGIPVISDFAALSAQYRRAYVQAIPSYGPADTYLNNAASQLLSAVQQACLAAEG